MGSDNKVEILVLDERGTAVDLTGWSIVPGTGTATKGDWIKALDPPTFTVIGNLVVLELNESRSGSENVAMSYVNAGYGTGLGQGTSGTHKEWPASFSVNEHGRPSSAHMCVNGDFQLPKTMNFPPDAYDSCRFCHAALVGPEPRWRGFGRYDACVGGRW